jgi:hypothetical protein
VTVNVELRFTRSKAKDALAVQVRADPKALPVQLTDEQIWERYPWDYQKLTAECRKRYIGFKVDKTYHSLRKMLKRGQALMRVYFEQWLNGLVYGLFFPDELHGRKLTLFAETAHLNPSDLSTTRRA